MIAQEAQYRDWMLAALAGDGTAYRMLLSGLTRHLRSYFARRLDSGAAEDAVQETLIAIHARRATYDPALPFTAWVYGIARYKLIDEYRRSKRHAAVPLEQAGDLFGHDEAAEAIARRDVGKLLAKLPEAKRRLVKDIKLDGVSVADAAARTGMSESAVKVSVHRAIKSLGEGLDKEDRDKEQEAPMRTDDLIAHLSDGLEPVKAGAVTRLLLIALGAGLAVSVAVMLLALGLRYDFHTAMASFGMWMKLAYTFALAAFGFWLVERAGRPGADLLRPAALLAVPVLAIAILSAAQMAARGRTCATW